MIVTVPVGQKSNFLEKLDEVKKLTFLCANCVLSAFLKPSLQTSDSVVQLRSATGCTRV